MTITVEAMKLSSQSRKTRVLLTFNPDTAQWHIVSYPENKEHHLRFVGTDQVFALTDHEFARLGGAA